METMTKGRIYGLVNQKDELRSLVFFDKNNRRHKQIDVSGTPHLINGKMELPHIHFGYNHNEKGDSVLSKHDKKLVDKASQSWYNYIRKK
ncbi:hypothetical protein Javan174_0036 [Streptococcus phage Javan174]|nr:hypothetical protein Javan174_0036 [Streptococcus phage Javan174]